MQILRLPHWCLGAQKNRFETSRLVCEDRGSRLSDVRGLKEALGLHNRSENTYWLPYRKERLRAWTWINNNTYSIFIIIVIIVSKTSSETLGKTFCSGTFNNSALLKKVIAATYLPYFIISEADIIPPDISIIHQDCALLRTLDRILDESYCLQSKYGYLCQRNGRLHQKKRVFFHLLH